MTDFKDTYAEFIELCFEGFDENATDPQDVLRAGERFGRIRANFLAGDPLREDEHETQERVAEFYKRARVSSAELLREVDRGLSLMGEFCAYKSRAMQRRLDGKIESATRLEANAERAYNQLPEAFKW